MFLSVIIPTRNRAKYLLGALESLTKQTYPFNLFEVIVIDNGSTDATKEICDNYKSRIPHLSYYYDASPGLHVGRHLGLKIAKAEILVYADDDIDAFPTWLEGIAEAFIATDVALVGGKILPKFEIEPPVWIEQMWAKDLQGNRKLDYLSMLDLGDEIKTINPCDVYGCNFSIKKSVLLSACGFHPDAMPQELIQYRGDGETHVSRYILEKGHKTVYHPKASVYHLVPSQRLTEEYFYLRKYNEGISDSYAKMRKLHLLGDSPKTKRNWKAPLRKITNYFQKNKQDERQLKIAAAHRSGYQYHQEQIKKNVKLMNWVLRDNYFDSNGDLPK